MEHHSPETDEALHHIARIDIEPDAAHPERSSTHGWLVRVRRQGVRTSKFFSDKKCGGREAALYEHAIPFRDGLLEELPAPDDPVEKSALARSQSGVVGLHFLYKDIGNGTRKPYVQLSWIDTAGKRHGASYSVEKWSLRRAVWNACLRLYKEKPGEPDPYMLFGKAYPNILKQYAAASEAEGITPLEPEAAEV